jgi:hypothetical protein
VCPLGKKMMFNLTTIKIFITYDWSTKPENNYTLENRFLGKDIF